MPVPNVEDIRPHPDSIWRCSCGRESKYFSYIGHRRWKHKHPECRGEGECIYDPRAEGATGESLPEIPQQEGIEPDATLDAAGATVGVIESPSEPDTSPSEPLPAFEYTGMNDYDEDPEEMARQLNLRRQQFPSTAGDGNGAGDLPPGLISDLPSLPAGDFSLEPMVGPPEVSRHKINILVPVSFIVFHDWARNGGWHQGAGKIDDWVTDVVLTCMREHYGLGVFVARIEDIFPEGEPREPVAAEVSDGAKRPGS